MGWGRPTPLLCELNLLGRPCGAGWVNKDETLRLELFGPFQANYHSSCFFELLTVEMKKSGISGEMQSLADTIGTWHDDPLLFMLTLFRMKTTIEIA